MDNKIEYALAKFNIATRDSDGNFRDIYDVLVDASKIYWNLEENQKDLLKELILGNSCSKHRFEEYMNTEQ